MHACPIIQSCLTLCEPMDCSPPGSSVHGIFWASILELPFPPPGDLPDPGIEPGLQDCRWILYHCATWGASQVVLMVKNISASLGDVKDTGLIPGSVRSPGGGHGNPLRYSCPENSTTEEPGELRPTGPQRVRQD